MNKISQRKIDNWDIRDQILYINEVKNVHHAHFWQLNDKDFFFEAHIDIENDIKITGFQKILSEIETFLNNNNITPYNIQPEYSRKDSKDLIIQH